MLPIAGNAAEHFTAVIVAARDKADLALAIALGSCVQARRPESRRRALTGPRLSPRLQCWPACSTSLCQGTARPVIMCKTPLRASRYQIKSPSAPAPDVKCYERRARSRGRPWSQTEWGHTYAVVHAQVAMFVVPVVCLVGWGYGRAFSLDMDPLLIVVLALAVVQTCARERGPCKLCSLSPRSCFYWHGPTSVSGG